MVDGELVPSGLHTLKKCKMRLFAEDVNPYWKNLSHDFLNEYNVVMSGKPKKHAVELF